jgi:hypothetical protein
MASLATRAQRCWLPMTAIDFLCWQRFDAPNIFAALLDPERAGAFAVAPMLDGIRYRQMYLPDTNVLVTCFHAPDEAGEVTDFMPFPGPAAAGRCWSGRWVWSGTRCVITYAAPCASITLGPRPGPSTASCSGPKGASPLRLVGVKRG